AEDGIRDRNVTGVQTCALPICTVTSPEINDQDGNGVLDTEQLSEAEQAIEAVEQAKIAADNKLSEITADGLVNLDEKAELDQLIEALKTARSEEHTSELQSRFDLVCRLLLEKKKEKVEI